MEVINGLADIDIDVVDGVPVYQPVDMHKVDEEEFAKAFLFGELVEISSHGEPLQVIIGDGNNNDWLYLADGSLYKFWKHAIIKPGSPVHQTKEEAITYLDISSFDIFDRR